MADKGFVRNKPLTFDFEIDLDSGNLNFVHDTPSHFAIILLSGVLSYD